MSTPAFNAYLSGFNFNTSGPVFVPVPTNRVSAPLTPKTAPLTDAALADVWDELPPHSIPVDTNDHQEFVFLNGNRSVFLSRDTEDFKSNSLRTYNAEIRASGFRQDLSVSQESTIANDNVGTNYDLKIALPIYALLVGAKVLSSDEPKVHYKEAELAFELAVRMYTEILPEEIRKSIEDEAAKHPEISLRERFGVTDQELYQIIVMFPGRELLSRDRFLQASDATRKTLDELVATIGVGYSSEGTAYANEGLLEVGQYIKNHHLQELTPTFKRLFEAAVVLVGLELPGKN